MIDLVFIALFQAAAGAPAPADPASPTTEATSSAGSTTEAATSAGPTVMPPGPAVGSTANAAHNQSGDVRCHREAITGTMRMHRVCTTRAQRDAVSDHTSHSLEHEHTWDPVPVSDGSARP